MGLFPMAAVTAAFVKTQKHADLEGSINRREFRFLLHFLVTPEGVTPHSMPESMPIKETRDAAFYAEDSSNTGTLGLDPIQKAVASIFPKRIRFSGP